jgi:hypothetical protein
MPCLAQPGGVLRRMGVWSTTQRKLAHFTMAKHLQGKEGILLTKSAEHVQVSALLILTWAKLFSLGNNLIEALLKTKNKTIYPGPLGQFKLLKEALLKFIFKQCKQGINVRTLSIVVVASNLSTKFGKLCPKVQCRQALFACSFDGLSYGHASLPAQARES